MRKKETKSHNFILNSFLYVPVSLWTHAAGGAIVLTSRREVVAGL